MKMLAITRKRVRGDTALSTPIVKMLTPRLNFLIVRSIPQTKEEPWLPKNSLKREIPTVEPHLDKRINRKKVSIVPLRVNLTIGSSQ